MEDFENSDDDFHVLREKKSENKFACKVELWRCLSGSVETLVRLMKTKSSFLSHLQNMMARVAFHGSQQSVWDSLMSDSSVRSAVRCVKSHDECLIHSILSQQLVRK